MSRCATCAMACTPASVRPAPYSSNSRRPVAVSTARSISPATVLAFFWICQPLYLVPAYSTTSLNLGIWKSRHRRDCGAGDGGVLKPDTRQVRDGELTRRRASRLDAGNDLAELRMNPIGAEQTGVER